MVGMLLLLTGCGPGPEAESGSASTGDSGRALSAGGLQFDPPIQWIPEMPGSPMRLAQYRVPSTMAEFEDAQFLIYYFEGQGGSPQANIDRWVSQFSNKDGSPMEKASQISQREVSGLQLTIVDVSGTYNESQGPMMAESVARTGYRMLAVIVEGTGGPWFLKLTGPQAVLDESEKAFDDFLTTLHRNPQG